MKRGAIGCCVLAVILAVSNVSSAQSPPTAATVLANVQQFYANANQLTASFRQTVTKATWGTSQASDGRVWVVKPSDFRWDYMAKRQGSVIVTKSFMFDGTTFWFVDHLNKQIMQMQPQSSALPAALSFLTGGSALTSQFGAALDASGTYGTKGTVVLRLTPNQPSAAYKELVLVVEPSDWHVKESIVIASNGDENDFKFFAPDLTATVKPGWFQVNPSSLPTYRLVKP